MLNTPKALNIRVKTKPALLEKEPGETGYQLCNGGGNMSRTRVFFDRRIRKSLSALGLLTDDILRNVGHILRAKTGSKAQE